MIPQCINTVKYIEILHLKFYFKVSDISTITSTKPKYSFELLCLNISTLCNIQTYPVQ